MFLVINTIGNFCHISLYNKKLCLIGERKKYGRNNQSENLLYLIEKLLNRYKVKINSLAGIKVFQGPGSYTGVRVGVATANALAYALNIPITAQGGDKLDAKSSKRKANDKIEYIIPKYSYPPKITTKKLDSTDKIR